MRIALSDAHVISLPPFYPALSARAVNLWLLRAALHKAIYLVPDKIKDIAKESLDSGCCTHVSEIPHDHPRHSHTICPVPLQLTRLVSFVSPSHVCSAMLYTNNGMFDPTQPMSSYRIEHVEICFERSVRGNM
eukprot:3934146-Amphidinium_carterae.1